MARLEERFEKLSSGHVLTDEDVAVAKLIDDLETSMRRPTPALVRKVAMTPMDRVRHILTPVERLDVHRALLTGTDDARAVSGLQAGQASPFSLSGKVQVDYFGGVNDSRREGDPYYRERGNAERLTYSRWVRRRAAFFLVLDGTVAAMAMALTLAALGPWIAYLPGIDAPDRFSALGAAVILVGALVGWPILIAVGGGYRRSNVDGDELRGVDRALVFALVGTIPAFLVNPTWLVSVCIAASLSAGVLSLMIRVIARRRLKRRRLSGSNVRKVIVVGSRNEASELSAILARDNPGMAIIGVCVPRAELDIVSDAEPNVVGDLEQVPYVVANHGVDAVVVINSGAQTDYVRELAWSLKGADAELLVHSALVGLARSRVEVNRNTAPPLVHIKAPHVRGWRMLVKRWIDILLSSVALIVLAPLMAAIALVVKLSDGGPVFYRQTRVGFHGEPFTMLKFRALRVDAEAKLGQLRARNPNIGLIFRISHDPRVTPVGRLLRRYSLDELPQLFNVLSGSMSIVGPRPMLQTELEVHGHRSRRRLLVTPGITGLWQVSGRSNLSWEEADRLDLFYVENWTLWQDLLIMLKTVPAVLSGRGAA